MTTVKRIVVSALGGAVVVYGFCLWMLVSPLSMPDGTACGSYLTPRTPDPTPEREYGCGDVRRERQGSAILVAVLGGPMMMGVLAATAAASLSFAR